MKELRDALKEKKVIIGTEKTMKFLKKGEVKQVYVSSNCPKDVKEDVEHYCKVFKINLIRVCFKVLLRLC